MRFALSKTLKQVFCKQCSRLLFFFFFERERFSITVKTLPIGTRDDPKILNLGFKPTAMGPKDAEGMTNSVDPDQTAHLGPHCDMSVQNVGSLRYMLLN